MPLRIARRRAAAASWGDGCAGWAPCGAPAWAVVVAPLLVGAEGRNSPTREEAGLNVARWSYDHVALVTSIGHERSHDNVAYEIFYPEGPFATLPATISEIPIAAARSGVCRNRIALVSTISAVPTPAQMA